MHRHALPRTLVAAGLGIGAKRQVAQEFIAGETLQWFSCHLLPRLQDAEFTPEVWCPKVRCFDPTGRE
jgi:hypothetical protein